MRALVFLAGLGAAAAAHADLYRWIDPQTGSVKLSSVPPPWQGERGAPAVEVLPSRAGPARLPGSKVAAPASSAAVQAASLPSLEARWREALQSVARLAAGAGQADPRAAAQRLEAFRGLNEELDRVDPAGAARRSAEAQAVFQGLAR